MNSKHIFVSILLFVSVLLSACGVAGITTSATPTQEVNGKNIVDLVNDGSLTFKLTSGGINELGLELLNKTDQALNVDILAGTFFVNSNPKNQNMIVLHPSSLSVQPNGQSDVQLEVACANLHLTEPTKEDIFTIQRTPQTPGLAQIIEKLVTAGVDFPVEQAAVWIVTDNATFDQLGMLVEGSRFGTSVINEDDAARAMMLVDEAGVPIRGRAIWADRAALAGKVTDAAASTWLDNAAATQAVEDSTQAVDQATIQAQSGTQVAQAETEVALQETQTFQAMPTAVFPFALTTKLYHETDDFTLACSHKFGSQWRTADWNDFLTQSQAGNSIQDIITTLVLAKNTPYLLLYDKEGWYTQQRHYYLEFHDHVLPGGWLSHANIDDHYIDLGSWYGLNAQVLCIKN